MPGEPREARVEPSASTWLGAVEEAPTELTAQEITAPFRPRLRLCGQSLGATLVRETRKPDLARPAVASPNPLCAPQAPTAVKVRAGASVGTQTEGVRRRLEMGSSRLFGSPRRRRPGGQARYCAPSLCFKSAPRETAPAAAGPAAAAQLDTPAHPGETCSGHTLSN